MLEMMPKEIRPLVVATPVRVGDSMQLELQIVAVDDQVVSLCLTEESAEVIGNFILGSIAQLQKADIKQWTKDFAGSLAERGFHFIDLAKKK